MIMKSPLPTLFFFICLPLLIFVAIFTTHLKTDISAFFIAGNNVEEILLASEIQSGTLSRQYILSIDAGEGEQVATSFTNAWLTQLKSIPGVVDVWAVDEKRGAINALSTIYAKHAAQTFSLNPEGELATLFTDSALAARALALKQALLSPEGELIKKVLVNDPLLLSLSAFKDLADQLKNKTSNTRYANFILETTMSGMNAPAQLAIQEKIQATFSRQTQTDFSQKQKASTLEYQLDMTGIPMFAVATQSMIASDIKFITVLSSVTLSLLFLFVFRSFRLMFWVFSLLISVITIAVLVTNFIFGSLHGMTLAIGSTLIGICIDYPIHGLVLTQGFGLEQRFSLLKKISPSLLMGALTTLIGYIALGFSGYPGFQQVAVFTGTGIMISLLLTRYLFPYLETENAQPIEPYKWISKWINFCLRFRSALLFLVLFLSLASVVQLDRLQWLQDLQQLTPELDYLKANDKIIRDRMSSMEPGRFVLISDKTAELAIQRAEGVYKRLDGLKKTGKLKDYFGLYPWLISEHQQLTNQKQLIQTLTPETRQRWQNALDAQGLSVQRLGLLSYDEQPPLSKDQVLKSSVGHLVSNQLLMTKEHALVLIWLAAHDPVEVQGALSDLEHVQYFSQRDVLNRMTQDYQQRAEWALFVGLCIIVSMLAWRYKSLFMTLQTLAPAFLAALLILGLWAWTGEEISFLHLIGFLLAVAICVDYGIFYQENRSGDLSLTYHAVAVSMMTSALVFSCLFFAQTSTLQILAKVVSCGVLLGFLLCPLLIISKQE